MVLHNILIFWDTRFLMFMKCLCFQYKSIHFSQQVTLDFIANLITDTYQINDTQTPLLLACITTQHSSFRGSLFYIHTCLATQAHRKTDTPLVCASLLPHRFFHLFSSYHLSIPNWSVRSAALTLLDFTVSWIIPACLPLDRSEMLAFSTCYT